MRENALRGRAFSMPLTSPAFPLGPYRFVNREYLIITYRTDPVKLRAVVPEPLEIDARSPSCSTGSDPHAGLQRLRRLHRVGTGHSRLVPTVARAAIRTACSSMTRRHRRRTRTVGLSEEAREPRRSGPKRIPSSARSTTARCARHRHHGLQHPPGGPRRRPLRAGRAELPPQDHSPCRRHAAHLRTRRVRSGGHRGGGRLDGAVGARTWASHALAPLAELPVLEVVSALHLVADLTLGSRQGRA